MRIRTSPEEGVTGKAPGPGSIMWDAFSDLTLSPFSIPILIMQAAHPDVGAAVAKYSAYQREPWGRLFRTGFSLVRFLYGGKRGLQSTNEAKDLRALHARIKGVREDGTSYHALRPKTFRVVPDTFLDGVVRYREAMGKPLSEDEKKTVFQEYINLCLLFGIPRSELEDTFEEFESYYNDLLLNTMTYNKTVSFLLEEMMKYGPKMKYVPLPEHWCQAIYHRTLYPIIRIFTLGFLDSRFRDLHEIEWSFQDQERYDKYVNSIKFLSKVIPRWARYNPLALYVMAGGQGLKLVSYEHLVKEINK